MNNFKIVGLLAALSASTCVMAEDYQFVATNNAPETKLCVNIANNDVDGTKSMLYRMGLGDALRRNINRITCNDMSVAKFAHKYKAQDTFVYLNNRSSYSNRERPSVTIKDIVKNDTNNQPMVVYVTAAP